MEKTDSLRVFDARAMDELRRQLDYSPSWRERLNQWMRLHQPSWNEDALPGFFDDAYKIFVYIVVGIGVSALAWMLFRGELASVWAARSMRLADRIRVSDEPAADVDFDRLIAQAVAERKYRWAVRYLYLKTLRLLSDGGLIVFQADKTNRQYEKELEEPLRSKFRELTRRFDYAWYGRREVTEAEFAENVRIFAELEAMIRR
ncbi:MAG: DUF4129 domain-containing protein [Bacteroidia bacterium]|nr:DUF4129 domain-containing protein [Bacteroidia bacterium]